MNNRPFAKLYINHYNKRMKYENAKNLSDREFRRNVGIKRETFERMLKIISVAYAKKHERRGRKPKLSLEDQLLAALEYWREYRTYARIALDFGIDESKKKTFCSSFQSSRWYL